MSKYKSKAEISDEGFEKVTQSISDLIQVAQNLANTPTSQIGKAAFKLNMISLSDQLDNLQEEVKVLGDNVRGIVRNLETVMGAASQSAKINREKLKKYKKSKQYEL